ncbi:MAG TPA: 30S ribosome-binding factor RbfA [Acholeplasmataceae bacterium]|jgi:ribosome-binding factor A|nr:30S ribosome-binding factor RbfA [Acholeplasmataceae bacterium]
MAYKKERLEKLIERELGRIIINETKDERLKYITITKVFLTEDLSIARVFYTILGTDNQIEKTKQNLQEAKGFLRTALSKKIKARKTPELRFQYDESFEYGNKIENILKTIEKK